MLIFKYVLDFAAKTVKLPKGARILALQMQGSQPCLWAEVDPDAETADVEYEVVGTGYKTPDPEKGLYYVSTVQTTGFGGFPLVFHIFMSPAFVSLKA